MSHPIPQEVEEKIAEFEKIWEHPLHRDTSSFTKASINAKHRQALLSVYNSGREAGKVQLTQTLQGRTDLGYEYLNGLEDALAAPSSEDNA